MFGRQEATSLLEIEIKKITLTDHPLFTEVCRTRAGAARHAFYHQGSCAAERAVLRLSCPGCDMLEFSSWHVNLGDVCKHVLRVIATHGLQCMREFTPEVS